MKSLQLVFSSGASTHHEPPGNDFVTSCRIDSLSVGESVGAYLIRIGYATQSRRVSIVLRGFRT